MEQDQGLRPLVVDEQRAVEAGIARFCQRWNQSDTLVDQVGRMHGDGRLGDIDCLDYVVYEHLYSLFAGTRGQFIESAGLVLGNVFVRNMGFQWCRLAVGESDSTLALVHPHSDAGSDVTLPIRELVAYRLTVDPQYGKFTELFLDVLLRSQAWPMAWEHPLRACGRQVIRGEASFEDVHGYQVPDDIRQQLLLLGFCDGDAWLRILGLEGYTMARRQEWGDLRAALKHCFEIYDESFGVSWRQRAAQAHIECLDIAPVHWPLPETKTWLTRTRTDETG